MLDSDQREVLLLLALYRRSERAGQAPAPEALLERNPGLADDLAHYFKTGYFLGRCGCCWSGSSDEMALYFGLLAAAVGALPEESFRVVALARLHGLSLEEISARLGLAAKIVRGRGDDVATELQRKLDGDE